MPMRTIALFPFFLLALGCGGSLSKAQSQLIGEWHAPDGGSLEFKNDGTLVMSGSGISMKAKYRFVADDSIEYQMDPLIDGAKPPLKIIKIEINGDELTLVGLTVPDSVFKYKRKQ